MEFWTHNFMDSDFLENYQSIKGFLPCLAKPLKHFKMLLFEGFIITMSDLIEILKAVGNNCSLNFLNCKVVELETEKEVDIMSIDGQLKAINLYYCQFSLFNNLYIPSESDKCFMTIMDKLCTIIKNPEDKISVVQCSINPQILAKCRLIKTDEFPTDSNNISKKANVIYEGLEKYGKLCYNKYGEKQVMLTDLLPSSSPGVTTQPRYTFDEFISFLVANKECEEIKIKDCKIELLPHINKIKTTYLSQIKFE